MVCKHHAVSWTNLFHLVVTRQRHERLVGEGGLDKLAPRVPAFLTVVSELELDGRMHSYTWVQLWPLVALFAESA